MRRTSPAVDTAFAGRSKAQRGQAVDRYQKLRPHLEQDLPLARVAAESGLPLRTAQRWVNRYRRFGLAGLNRAARADQGKRRRLSDELRHLAEGLALQKPPRGPGAIYREVRRFAQTEGYDPPGYHTIYNLIRGLRGTSTVLPLDGGRSGNEVNDIGHWRVARRPNQIWHAFHARVDLWVRRDDGRAAQPWVTIIIDDYSRAIAGFFFSLDRPSALLTALVLRQAIWRKPDADWVISGIPEILCTDYGSDFTSAHLEQVATALKIRLIFANLTTSRGGGRIERVFKAVNRMFLANLLGCIGRETNRSERSLTLTELDRRFRQFLRKYHTHSDGETEIPPQERWQQGGFAPRSVASLEELDLLLPTVAKPRKIQPDGIRFQGMNYIHPMLAIYVGEKVHLRYDPRDLSEVRLFYRDKFLCNAVCREIAGQTVALQDIRRVGDSRN
jgi:putative transposase